MNTSFFTKSLSIILIASILTSCASILSPRYQKVTINSDKGAKILVDGEKPGKKKGKYLIDKKGKGTQIQVSKEGFKDEYAVIAPYKRNPLRFVTLVTTAIPLLWYGYVLDKGAKSYLYEKRYTIGKNMLLLPKKGEEDKEIQLNKVAADISSENIKFRYFRSYKHYLRKEDRKKTKSDEDIEDVEIENTVFSDLLNKILKKSGFIDTTKRALKNSYANNLLLNANIIGFTFHRVQTGTNYIYGGTMTYIDVEIDWEVLDYYKKPIYTTTTTSTSGQFIEIPDKTIKGVYKQNVAATKKYSKVFEASIQDAMEYGLLDFLSEKKVQTLLKDRSVAEEEANFTTLEIPKSSKYVSSLSEAVSSGVTIKNKEGHGSGFFISGEGHIITNYHVIANNEDLKVVTNDGKEFDVEILRESRVNDLALLKIKGSNFLPFKIEKSKELDIASTVYAIGTPSSSDLSQTISKGIISGIRDSDFGTKLIQTDVSINGGNSGGAIIDKEGKVLGVVSAKLVGYGVEGVAFGIPAYEIYDKLKLK